MRCNTQIHDELKNMEEPLCPFCDQLLTELTEAEKVIESCCCEQDMENVNGMNVCINCGSTSMKICIRYGENRFIIGSTILRMC